MHSLTLVFLPQVLIAVVTWLQVVVSLPSRRKRIKLISLWLLFFSAVVRYVAALSLYHIYLTLQFSAAICGAALNWIGYILLLNDDVMLPSGVQTLSLLNSVIVTMLWEVSNYIVFTSLTDKSVLEKER